VTLDESRKRLSNLELVRSIHVAWERGDFRSTEWAHPEIEFVIADRPEAGEWSGVAGLGQGFRGWLGVWEDWRAVAEEYRELDYERVLVLARYSGRGKTSGVDLTQTGTKSAALFHVRNGKVTRLVAYWNRDSAVADLRLPPEAGSPGKQ
jgi:ketosteroid isomerase-like protein